MRSRSQRIQFGFVCRSSWVFLIGTAFGITALLPTAVTFSSKTVHAQIATKDDEAELKESVTRDLSPGQTLFYEIKLPPETYLLLNLTASGIRVRASFSERSGRTLIKTACSESDPIALSWIADHAQPYRLEVSACERQVTTGSFELKIEEKRFASPPDHTRVAAWLAATNAETLRSQGSGAASREAVREYEEALRLFHSIQDLKSEVLMKHKIGQALYERGEITGALRYFKEALSSTRQINNPTEEIKTLNWLATLQTDLGEYQEAQSACSLALRLSQSNKNSAGEAQALSNLGVIDYYSGKMRKSLDQQQQALHRWLDLRDRRGEAQSLSRMGDAMMVVGEVAKARDSYEQALSLYQALEDYWGQAQVLTALGQPCIATGNKQEALNYFDQALQLGQRMENAQLMAIVYSQKGVVYYQLGELDKSLQYREQALELYHQMADKWGESAMHRSIGRIHRALGNPQQALDHYHAGLAIARSMPNLHLESALLSEVGAIYDQLGQFQNAVRYYEQSLSLGRRSEDPRDQAEALNQLGTTYAKMGPSQKALNYFNQALSLTRSVTDRAAEAQTLSNIAQVERDNGQLDEARKRIVAALEIIESLRANVISHNLRTSYFATVSRQYEIYVDVLMQLDQAQPARDFATLAFETSERARARTLLEMLSETGADIRQGIDPALLSRATELEQQLNSSAEQQVNLLSRSHTKEDATALDEDIRKLTSEHQEVEDRIRATSPRYAALIQPQPLSLKEIQQQVLDDNTLLLEYFLGDDRSYLWAVTRTEISSFVLPGRASIETLSRNVYESLAANQRVPGETFEQYQTRVTKANEQLPSQVGELSKILLEPVAAKLGAKRLLIVADGALQYLPFQLLEDPSHSSQTEPPGSTKLTRPAQLVEAHEIINEPSASTLALLVTETKNRKPPSNSVAVLADPVFEADDPRIASATRPEASSMSTPGQETELHQALRDVSLTGEGGHIPRLLASRDEANAIMSVTPWRSGFEALDFKASRATVMKADLGDYRIVHFATHGLLNTKHPELSGVVLSLFDQTGQTQDGFLRMHDIYNLKLPVDLVVLSACNTGLGKDVRGEGLIGLTRGFMYAGASSVVASLWKVDDEATSELMRLFYGFMLRDGLSPAAALRKAQVTMSQQKRWQSPYYWSGFIIQGQYIQREPLNNWPLRRVALLVGVSALLVLAAFFVVKRRRRTIL